MTRVQVFVKARGCSVSWTLAPDTSRTVSVNHIQTQCCRPLLPGAGLFPLFHLYLTQTHPSAVQFSPSPFLLKSQCWFFIFYWDISMIFTWDRTSSQYSFTLPFHISVISQCLTWVESLCECVCCLATDWAQWSIFNAFLIPFPIAVFECVSLFIPWQLFWCFSLYENFHLSFGLWFF